MTLPALHVKLKMGLHVASSHSSTVSQGMSADVLVEVDVDVLLLLLLDVLLDDDVLEDVDVLEEVLVEEELLVEVDVLVDVVSSLARDSVQPPAEMVTFCPMHCSRRRII